MASEGADHETTGGGSEARRGGDADRRHSGTGAEGRAIGTGGSAEPKAAESTATGPTAAESTATDPKTAAAVAAAEAAGPSNGESVRIDSWIWSVRLVKTRSMGAAACRGGHVRVNGERVKPAYNVHVGDEVRLRHEGRERIVVVKRLIRKRVGAPVAVQCYVDNSPPPPPREAVAPAGVRDRGAGRPTKRDRREMERLRGLGGAPGGGSAAALGAQARSGGPSRSGGQGRSGGRDRAKGGSDSGGF
jgi:ribosome-associated heat shock protein Hsp15